MKKYRVTTTTEDIVITANTQEQLSKKIDFIKSFETVICVAIIIES